MSSITSYPAQAIEYFSPSRIIAGNVIAGSEFNGVAVSTVAATQISYNVAVFGGFATDKLVRVSSFIEYQGGNAAVQNVATGVEEIGSHSIVQVCGVFPGVPAGVAAANVFALNDPGVAIAGQAQSRSSGGLAAALLAGTNVYLPLDSVFLLKAGDYAFSFLTITIQAIGTDQTTYYVRDAFTFDDMS